MTNAHRAGDLQNPRWMILKAALLLAIGVTSSLLILLEVPQWKTALLLALAIWSCARCYYFAFYVIERCIDPSYRFAGLTSAFLFLMKRKRNTAEPEQSIGKNRRSEN